MVTSMKTSPTRLPSKKRDELKQIVSVIRDRCDDVEMIILFGSYARGDYKEEGDLAPDRKSGHVSDYDILVVTGEKSTATDIERWQKITRECDAAGLSAPVRIIAHDVEALNIELAEGQYFYSDVRKEGCLLYDSENFKLAHKRKLTPKEQKRIAEDHFDHWFGRARDFIKTYAYHLDNGMLKLAAFDLHQCSEACYKAVMLVFTNYSPNEHLLKLLGSMAAEHDSALNDIFPTETKEECERFELLDCAYIGARYHPDYRIGKEDLAYLSNRVGRLLDLTEKICSAKIESFTN